jgi:hypothetical protein
MRLSVREIALITLWLQLFAVSHVDHTAATQATVVAGTVLDGVTRRSVDGATVALSGQGPTMTAQTNAEGRFTFTLSAAASRVRIEARKTGYLVGQRGQLGPHDPFASALDIQQGENLQDVVIRIWPEGVIAGSVRDERGDPVVGATVVALTDLYTGAGPQWWRASTPVVTNDRGEYRIERLAPREYILAARAPASAPSAPIPAPSFHPGVSSISSAARIAVMGESYTLDIRLGTALKTRTVSGRLVGADRSPQGMVVRLCPTDPTGAAVMFADRMTKADAEGRFQFDHVPEGAYRVRVQEFPAADVSLFSVSGDFQRYVTGFMGPRPPGHPQLPALPTALTWVADMAVTVDAERDVAVVVPLQEGVRIRGRVIFEGAAQKPTADELLSVPVVIRPALGNQSASMFEVRPDLFPQSRIERDGTFASIGLPPGDYVLGLLPGFEALRNWKLGEIRSEGRDITGRSLTLGARDVADVVIVLTDRSTGIAGTVSSPQGRPAGDARVIIFPQNPEEWRQYWSLPAPRRILQAMPDRQGSFVAQVPPGQYLVTAVTSDLPERWMAPDYLELLASSASPVRVALGDQRSVTLTARTVSQNRR